MRQPFRSNAYFRIIFLSLLMISRSAFAQEVSDADQQKLDFFENKIRPVLVTHCYECHSSDSKEVQGGLLVDSRKAIRAGGESGAAVSPGDVENSLILDALRHDGLEMPPKQKLADGVIADFEKWIVDGAIDPREDGKLVVKDKIDIEAGREFWVFQPIVKPELPAVKDTSWPLNEIDRFILAKLESKEIVPSADAERIKLVRRIYFDLIGLPPKPEEIESFLNDTSPDAFGKLVDRLLASKHFGERWGRHWLDIARYADSSGGGRVKLFPDAWRYRDYVIESFNNDKPIDQFFVEQIAGDLLPHDSREQRSEQLTATGFLMLGAHNYELQDKELLRMEVVDEQINVVGRAMLGMTLSCARCHDHKFDPIPTSDYYAMAGIFRSTKSLLPGNVAGFVETELPLAPEEMKLWESHQAKIAAQEKRLKEIEAELSSLGGSKDVITDPKKLKGMIVDDLNATLQGTWKASTSVKPFVADGYHFSNEKGATATYEFEIKNAAEFDVFISHTASSNRPADVRVVVHHASGKTEKSINQKKGPTAHLPFNALGRYTFEKGIVMIVLHSPGVDAAIADAVQLIPVQTEPNPAKSEQPEISKEREAQAKRAARRKALQKERSTAKQAIDQLKKNPSVSLENVMSVREADDAADFAICVRGDVHNLGDPVQRGAMSVVSIESRFDLPGKTSGRLELARWITNGNNPLMARVYANRVWHHLFGSGLVRTTDNFGAMGERPSNPQLLDFLASRLMDGNYSTKNLIREIVTSRTYRQRVVDDPVRTRIDPENQLFWRANRRRLDAESMRDAILMFSGKLDLRSGGPSIKQGTSREFGYKFDSNRRGVYLPVFRNTLCDLYDVFDFPNPNLVSGRRTESTLATQSLFLMNSNFVNQHARFAAERLLTEAYQSERERIDFAWVSALGRHPELNETLAVEEFLKDFDLQDKGQSVEAWTGVCKSLISCLDFRYIE